MEEENTQEQTYAYELDPNSEELFKIKKQELKDLKKKAARDKVVRLANVSQKRVIRDDKIERISLKLKTIKDQMVHYNRAGKVEKDRTDILANIIDCINYDVDLIEEIERGKPEEIEMEVRQEDMEAEAFVQPQN